MKREYNSNYLGIVVQNDDPEKRGRIKIFIPHLSVTLYSTWNSQKNNRAFAFPDREFGSDLTDILPELRECLPWAECAMPLFGGNASARYNAATEKGTSSDSNYWEEDKLVEGQRPLHNYSFKKEYSDPFTDSGNINNQFTNPYGKNYTPSNYSNIARGLFTIPNVGAHVWVFFKNGDCKCPIYFAASCGEEDWKRIYSTNQNPKDETTVDYPGKYENHSKDDGGDPTQTDDQTFRAKTVFNSNKHSIELVDTDNREILKMTHYSGSFKEFTNQTSIEFAVGNDQKQVIGDQFLTIRKNQGTFIEGGREHIVKGSDTQWVGLSDQEKVKQVITSLRELNKYKRLFDLQRASSNDIGPKQLSPLQTRSGDFAPCPVCEQEGYIPSGSWYAGGLPRAMPLYRPVHGGLGVTHSYFQIAFFPDPITEQSVAHLIGKRGYYMGSKCDVCNGPHLNVRPEGYKTAQGFSPSTEFGEWVIDPLKEEGIKKWQQENLDDILKLEKELDDSNQIITISNNKIETIGLGINDLPSIRTDPFGKLRIDGVHTAPEGTYTTYKTVPLVEYVDVDDVPGGDYNLVVSNKYKLLVGARGVNIKTFGPLDMYGSILNLTGEQINISSQNEVSLDAGERLSMRARSIALSPYEHNPVVVDGQLHVTRNTIIQGSAMVEGELGLSHITSPGQYYQTMMSTPCQTEMAGGYGLVPHTHGVPPHTHFFVNIPLNLLKSPNEVRSKMISQSINSTKANKSGESVGGIGNTRFLGEPISQIPGIDRVPGLTSYAESGGLQHLVRNDDGSNWGGPIIASIEAVEEYVEGNVLNQFGLHQMLAEQIDSSTIKFTCTFDITDGTSTTMIEGLRTDVEWKIPKINIIGKEIPAIDNEEWRYRIALAEGKTSVQAEKAKKNATNAVIKITDSEEDVVVTENRYVQGPKEEL